MTLKSFLNSVVLATAFSALIGLAPTQAQAPRPLLTHHVPRAVASGQASFLSRLPAARRMNLAVVLAPRNDAERKQLLQDLYNTASPQYRHFLSVQQFTERFGPAQSDYDAVIAFARANGMSVTHLSANRLVVDVSATVASVERTFHVTMGIYAHPTEPRAFYAPDREPTVNLSVPLWRVAGLNNYSLPTPAYKKGSGTSNTTGSGPGGSFLGSDRRAAYYGGTALTGTGQAVGLVEFDGYALGDVQAYFTNVGQPLNVPINNVLVNGANAGSDGDDMEQAIDIVEAISMAPGLSQVRVYIGPKSGLGNGGDADIFNEMATENIAKQLSCSWLWGPDDPGNDEPFFEEFGIQGQSLFAASGDYGTYDSSYPHPYFYPAEDPDVTAVGGTNLVTNGAGGAWQSETAWGGTATSCGAGTGSGGGHSPDGLPIGTYQQLAGVINSSNQGSTKVRNVPDVAAEGNCDNYYCANGSCSYDLGGTSLAAPTWAGFAALVNEQRLADGESTLGFINFTIYPTGLGSNYSNYFHDITVGDNFNTDSPSLYSAVTGYDLVTGWGSPAPTGWLATASGTFAFTGSLNHARSNHTATLLQNGMVLIVGGYNGSSVLSSAELYNPSTGAFTTTGSLNTPREFATATLLNSGEVLIVGGYSGSAYLNTAELYNPTTGAFTYTSGHMTKERSSQTATLLQSGVVLVAGGCNICGGGGGYLASAELYNPSTGTFALTTGNMQKERAYHTATLLNDGTVLLAGACNICVNGDGYLDTAEIYNPTTERFSFTNGNMNNARASHTATLLQNGLVLVAGGYNGSFAVNGVDLYSPSTGDFNITASLNDGRELSAAALLSNGMVLVAGGYNLTSYLSEADLYNPSAGTFTLTGNLNTARASFTATLLNNGTVLVVGGYNGSYLASAEIFQY
jgi:subtilase family serine protease